MLDKIKSLFGLKKETKQKEVIIFIHGFGARRSHEFDNFNLWNNNKYEIKTFDIYNIDNMDDCNPTIWIRRCEGIMESYINAGYKIYLIGFSMGGVLATHLASKYKTEKLFLVSPAFEYLRVGNVTSAIKNKINKKETNPQIPSVPTRFTPCFIEVVRLCKDDINKVTCPICFVHGDQDEVISPKSSINAFAKVSHENKKMFLIHEGKHRLLLDENTSWEVFQIFTLFIENKILGKEKAQYAPDIFIKKENNAE